MESLFYQNNFLSDEDQSLLRTLAKPKSYAKNDIIVWPNTTYEYFSYIASGIVRFYLVNPLGEERTIFLPHNDMFFGTPEFVLNRQPTQYTIAAMTEVELIQFKLKDIETLASQHPNIFTLYIKYLKVIIAAFVQRLEAVPYKPEERYEQMCQKRPILAECAFKKDFAQFIGVTPNSLSRIIARKKL